MVAGFQEMDKWIAVLNVYFTSLNTPLKGK